jgi:DUF1680 family protein
LNSAGGREVERGLRSSRRFRPANFHQGWPKFTTSLWMGQDDNSIVATLYAPSEVRAELAGTKVHIVEEAEYPFRDNVRFSINPDTPASFGLGLRIPIWSSETHITLNGRSQEITTPPGGFMTLRRKWSRGDVVEIKFNMQPRVSRWFNRSFAIERGPLVFSKTEASGFRLRTANLRCSQDYRYDPFSVYAKSPMRSPTLD